MHGQTTAQKCVWGVVVNSVYCRGTQQRCLRGFQQLLQEQQHLSSSWRALDPPCLQVIQPP